MNRSISRSCIVVALLLLVLPFTAAAAEKVTDRLLATALSTGQPVIVDFGKGQCVQCIKQAAVIDELRPLCEDLLTFEFVNVFDEDPLAQHYEVLMIPTLVFLDGEGKEVFRHVGFYDTDQMRTKITELSWVTFK